VNLEPAADDDVLDAPDGMQIALGIDEPQVP
jgi:hypothetical protein